MAPNESTAVITANGDTTDTGGRVEAYIPPREDSRYPGSERLVGARMTIIDANEEAGKRFSTEAVYRDVSVEQGEQVWEFGKAVIYAQRIRTESGGPRRGVIYITGKDRRLFPK